MNFIKSFVKIHLFVLLTLATGNTNAETLESIKVRSIDNLEKCFAIQPYELLRKHESSLTNEWIDESKIGLGCVAKAVELAKKSVTNPKLIEQIADSVAKGFKHENAVDVYLVLFEGGKNLVECENSDFYGRLIEALSHPKDYPNLSDSYVNKAEKLIDLCLKQKQFKKDIIDEIDTNKTYTSKNICLHLKETKIIEGGRKCPNQ